GDRDAVIVPQRRLDHLSLNLAVHPNVGFGVALASTDRDQRILIREFGKRGVHLDPLVRIDRLHARFEDRRIEGGNAVPDDIADPVADPRVRQPVNPHDISSGCRRNRIGASIPKKVDTCDLRWRNLLPGSRVWPHDRHVAPYGHRAGPDPADQDALAVRLALHLEHFGGERRARVRCFHRRKHRERVEKLRYTGAGYRRAEQNRRHTGPGDLLTKGTRHLLAGERAIRLNEPLEERIVIPGQDIDDVVTYF